jgi:PAS domain S-box-containing protein
VSGALLLAAFYLLIGQTIIARSALRRQRAEEALRASEKRFKALCEQAPVGIYSTDAQGLGVYTNPRWSQMSGLSAAESLGHGWKKALHPEDRETVFEQWKTNALRGASWEYRLLTPEGEIRWIRALGGPIYSDRGEVTGYVGTVEDITERKCAHRALEEREALNRAVLNSLPAHIAVLNQDGTIQTINEEWQRFTEANGDPPACFLNRGANYLEACKRASEGGSSDAERALSGIRDVLSGRLESFTMQYQCRFANERKWFHMLVTSLAGVTSGGVVIAHVDITERKQAQDAMQEALQQLHIITDNMPAGVTRCSRDLRFLWASPTFAAWQGLTPEEIANRPILEVVGPEAYEAKLPHMEKVLSGEREEYEAQVNYRGVGLRWIHAVYVPTRAQNHEVDGWIGVLTDVTERHEAEERLRESEERFRNMADTAPVMIWASGPGPDRGCTFFNKVWLDFTGRTMEQELGNGWAETVHPDDLEYCLAVYSSAFDTRQSFEIECRLRRADGAYRWLLGHGVPRFMADNVFHGYIGSCFDITERIRAEEERQKFVSLADSSMEFIGMCNRDFQLFYVNAAGLRLVGLDNFEEACRFKLQDCFFPEDQPFITNEFFPRVLGDGHGKVEIRFRHFKTGEAIWMIYNVFNICDTHGATVGWATVSVDITERRRAELALQESRQELRALAGRLINTEEQERKRISRELHDDLNQKLACLAFDADGLRMMPFSSEDKIREELLSLRTRIVELSKDVREISHRLHPSILDDLGLIAALDELSQEFSTRERVEVQFTHEAVPPAIPAEVAACLYRVAQEAIHNVLKHARADYVRMRLSGDSRGIHLSIHDTGVGFDSEAGLRRPGLGILSMKERVLLVHGEFSIHSQPGQGTEVRVFVPLPKEALRAA